jgi:hypothetical protein
MQENLHNPEGQEKGTSHSRMTLFLSAVVLLAIGTSLWFLLKPTPAPKPRVIQAVITPRMGEAEREYAKSLRVENIALSRAENFLHQEVTTLNAEIVNGGAQAVTALQLSVEFSDDMNQIVLREARGVLGTPPAALAPGERRPIEIAFEHIPDSWNMQQPAVHVTYLQLARAK